MPHQNPDPNGECTAYVEPEGRRSGGPRRGPDRHRSSEQLSRVNGVPRSLVCNVSRRDLHSVFLGTRELALQSGTH